MDADRVDFAQQNYAHIYLKMPDVVDYCPIDLLCSDLW